MRVTASTVFDGSGEMCSIMRAHDWKSSPLGPADDWPQSLKTAVHILLSSRFSMWMAWGPELVFFYNDAYRKATLGEKHPWALGRPAREVWSEIWGEIGPRIQSVLNTGIATWDEGLLLFLERNGFSEETYHTFSYSPLKDDNGMVAGMLCVVTEETNRVLGERQLASLKRFASELGTAITSEEVCQIVIANCRANQQDLPFTLTYLVDENERQAQLFCATGFDDHDPAAPSTIDLNSSSSIWPISSVLEANDLLVIYVKEVSDRLPKGAWGLPANKVLLVPIAQRGQKKAAGVLIAGLSPYRILNNDYEGYIKLIAGQLAPSLANADAYEQERKRALALAEIDRAKTMFFSNVSHELRTPLTLMLGPLEDELARADSGESKRSLELIHRNGLRLLKLVNTLLEFSRVESGRLNSRFEPVDLAKLTAEYASAFHSAIERAGLRFVVDCRPLPEAVYLDRDMWEKIILNLLSNSLKSTFQGEIAVTVRTVEGGAQVAIRDTGTGIPEDEVPHLFERFRRVEGAHRRTHEGSGIGLALVHELVGLHGGAIDVETATGNGTTFTVTLPFGRAHLPPEKVSTTEAARTGSSLSAYVNEALTWLPQHSNNGHVPAASLEEVNGQQSDQEMPRVLLADDNRDMRDYVSQLLGKKFRVEVAENGKTALELALSDSPDLILTDVMMPEMDGFELLAAVRQSDALKDVPVIMLSARAGEESRIDGLGAGADDYVVKPFTARELMARVSAQVAMARLRQEAAKRERELLVATEVERNRLRESETRLKLATEAAKLGVFVWDTVEDRGNWENDRMYEIFGRTREGGLVNGAVFINEVVHPDHRDAFQQAVKATLEQGNAFEFEGMIYRLDQSLRWIEINGHLQVQGDDTPAGRILGTVRDITHIKKSEEALRNSFKQLSELAAIVASSDDVILSKDLNGIITSWNAAATRVFGYTAEEMVGSSILKLIPEELRSEEETIIEQVRAGHMVEHFETVRLTKSGRKLDVSLTISPVRDEQGRIVGASKILRDISGRKRMEQTLLQAEKIAATSRMAATIAHEVNNPLEAVMNLLYLLRPKITDSEGIEYLNSAETELGRVSHIAKQTLGYYREHTSASRASLADIALQAISIYEPRCTVAGITIRKSLHSSKLVALRRGEMMQVISNLISNSIYAMPTGGTLSISVEDTAGPEDGILLVIQDDGVGIAADDLPRVFDAFFSTRTVVGTGIGLFVTKQFVEGHGGHIEIMSRNDAEHHGTAVYVFLPLHTPYDDSLTSSSVH
jgi:PAS domain S-box-containing protein